MKQATRVQGAPLRGPSKADMGVRVPETLEATIDVRLAALRNKTRAVLFEGQGRYAGLEVVGETDRLMS